jgi:hypothetical protein
MKSIYSAVVVAVTLLQAGSSWAVGPAGEVQLSRDWAVKLLRDKFPAGAGHYKTTYRGKTKLVIDGMDYYPDCFVHFSDTARLPPSDPLSNRFEVSLHVWSPLEEDVRNEAIGFDYNNRWISLGKEKSVKVHYESEDEFWVQTESVGRGPIRSHEDIRSTLVIRGSLKTGDLRVRLFTQPMTFGSTALPLGSSEYTCFDLRPNEQVKGQ